jgi:hypothetical protein
VYINSSLVAFLESDFVSIWELKDGFVWGPELDSCVVSNKSCLSILSHERFVVKGPEVATLSFVWVFWRITEHISEFMTVTMIVVSISSYLAVDLMNINLFFFWSVLPVGESLNQFRVVIKSRCEYESFVGVLSSI